MKHIKNFENFKLNELTGALRNRASEIAHKRATSDENTIKRKISSDQYHNFQKYINPEIIKFAKKNNISIDYNYGDYSIELGDGKIIWVPNFKDQGLDPAFNFNLNKEDVDKIPINKLRVVNRLLDMLRKDEENKRI